MTVLTALDSEAIGRACERHGVSRLRVFGSVLTDDFDPHRSDVDFIVEFAPHVEHPFDAYFGLREELESVLGRHVDLVMAQAVKNPYFAASVNETAREIYAA